MDNVASINLMILVLYRHSKKLDGSKRSVAQAQTSEHHALLSQTGDLPLRPPGILFDGNPSGWAFGRLGQIHLGRASSFRAHMTDLAADEFPLPGEAVDERRWRDEVGVGTLAEAAAVYRPHSGALGLRRSRRLEGGVHRGRRPEAAPPPPPAPSSSTAASRLRPGFPSSSPCATTSPSSARPSCAASPTRWPSSGGTACSPRCPVTRTGSCCATPSGLTRPTSTTQTSPRATGRPGNAAYPARGCASASPSKSTRTQSRSVAATESPARRARGRPWAAVWRPGRCSSTTRREHTACWSGTAGSRKRFTGPT